MMKGMKARIRLGVAAFVGCGIASCLFPNVGDLTGQDGAAEASSTDAGDAGAADATSDAKSTDATTDASSARFCTTQDAAFCADFDESADVMTGFTSVYLTDGGLVAVDDAASSSPPSSLLSGNFVLASSDSSHGCVVAKTSITPSSSLVLDMDLRIDELASQGTYIEAFAIVLESATQSAIQLNLAAASTAIGEEIDTLDAGKLFIPHTFAAPIAMSTWSHLNVTLVLEAPRTITVTVDTTIVVDHAPMNSAFVVGPTDVYAGNAYSPGPSDGARIHYDNIVLRLN
jgi:hypothetical protein